MQRTVQAFLAAGIPVNEIDQAAFRALTVLAKLDELMQNAGDRGYAQARFDIYHTIVAPLLAFKVCNGVRKYPFAGELRERLDSVTLEFSVAPDAPEGTKPEVDLNDPRIVLELAGQFIEGAEACAEHYKDSCTPTYAIRGVDSVRIVRGDYCQLLAQPAVNDNQKAA